MGTQPKRGKELSLKECFVGNVGINEIIQTTGKRNRSERHPFPHHNRLNCSNVFRPTDIHAICFIRTMFIRTLRLKNAHFLRTLQLFYQQLSLSLLSLKTKSRRSYKKKMRVSERVCSVNLRRAVLCVKNCNPRNVNFHIVVRHLRKRSTFKYMYFTYICKCLNEMYIEAKN